MSKEFSRALHWFRRDLRLTDNSALSAAMARSAEVVPVYVVSDWKKSHAWTGPPRQAFLAGCLASLEKNIASGGGELIFRRGKAVAELARLVQETGAEAVFYNKDPDPFGQKVEDALEAWGKENGVKVFGYKDAVLHERAEVLTGAGKPYRVFTPYRRNWETLPKPPVLAAVTKWPAVGVKIKSEACPVLADWGLILPENLTLPEPGERAARQRMKAALADVIPRYAETRNTPLGATTSRLSPDLRMGTLSIRELYHRVITLAAESGDAAVQKSCATYVSELAWREFYMQLLWHFPEVLEHEFDPQWRGLAWSYDQAAFQRWKDGMTGFPIVDAGMRELKATGQMHNRVRMITAMFLTKDLRLDWRLGEQYFMQALIDGEIASNNGGWQWSAGTGADAAPYFRIQNPWSQTKSYDPKGDYIRHWVPELKNAPLSRLLEPPVGDLLFTKLGDYPSPMVNHSEERDRTLTLFKSHRAAHQAG
jgi:deoxyribodipyrimidine photo-lyase